MAGLHGKRCLVLLESTKLSSKVAVQICIPTSKPAMNENFCCSHPCQHLVVFLFWILAVTIGYVGVSYCHFNFWKLLGSSPYILSSEIS